MNFWRGCILFLSLLLGRQTAAQKQVVRYYDKDGEETNEPNAVFIKTILIDNDATAIVHFAKLDGSKISTVRYRDYELDKKDNIGHGPYQEWHDNGQLAEEGSFLDDKLNGRQTCWHKNGQVSYIRNYRNNELQDTLQGSYESGALRRFEVYEDDLLIEGAVYAEDGTEIIPYFPYQQMPQFPGGEKAMFQFICARIRYPKSAIKKDISGSVQVSFDVSREGYIGNVQIQKGVHPTLDAETIRVIKAMPKWEPGKTEGKPVPVRYNMPVKFTLE